MKKQILHITAHLGGGVGKAILGAAAYQNEQFETQIVMLEEPEKREIIEKAQNRGIKIHICPRRDHLEEWMKEADVVVINWWNHPLMSKFLCEIPSISTRLAIWVHVNGCTYPYLPFEFLNAFEYIFFTTKFSYENSLWSKKEIEIIRSKSKVILGNGDFQPKKMISKQEYRNREIVRVGYIGTLNYSKINKDYVKFCEKAAEYTNHLKFIMAGDVDPLFLKDIEKSAVKDQFELLDYIDDVEDLYLSFDMLGYILNEDNFGTTENVILEAMAYGVPVIAHDGGVERAIIDDQKNGILVHNPEEYAECVRIMAEDVNLREKIGQAGREKVCTEFSGTDNVDLLWKCYKKICTESKKRYSFKEIIGKNPLDWFLYFTGRDRSIFEEYLQEQTKEALRELCLRKPIYKGERKSSIKQFLKYFPEETKLQKMADEIRAFQVREEETDD